MDTPVDAPDACAIYRRRRPERTPLYRTVQAHLETYLALAREGHDDGGGVPQYVEGEFRRDAAPDNVQLFTPHAGSGRFLHMASTTVIIDDAYLITGTTRLWRRSLTFDSSLAIALLDNVATLGRPATIINARRQLLADRLALAVNQVPDDSRHILDAVKRLNAAGGIGRVVPAAYTPTADPTNPTDIAIWNPDGRPRADVTDWFLFFAANSAIAAAVNLAAP